jgi:cytochrome c oxidase cbb3-type subunit I/II
MIDPRTMSPGSIMPRYPWLADQDLDMTTTEKKLKAMQTLGVPYSNDEITNGNNDLSKQAAIISENLKKEGIALESNKELVAVIAYLQRMGTDIKKSTVSN